MKICPRCNSRPSIRNEKKTNAPYCKDCQIVYAQERRQRKLAIIIAAKSVPCIDCGGIFPHYVMDLDHLDNKFESLSGMASYSDERIKNEISKCEPVCSNCHRIRTYERSHSPVA